MQEVDAVKENNAAGGLITDDQADKLFELSRLKLIVQAFGMVGGKKVHQQKLTLSFHPFLMGEKVSENSHFDLFMLYSPFLRR